MTDYLSYYDLERYLFEDVHKRFHKEHSIGASDFFSIIIWKANRAKSLIASRLLRADPEQRHDLDAIAHALTASLYSAPEAKERLRILIKEWGLGLPMATAILTVFWPEVFTVYDVRVRKFLGYARPISTFGDFEKIWSEYLEFVTRLREWPLGDLSLRERDRYMWAMSARMQLEEDIKRWQASEESVP